MNNDLIYGKCPLERIVGIEPHDGYAEIFVQAEDGSIQVDILPNKYWILSSKPLGNNWTPLDGNLHYKYGKQFATREDFTRARYVYKDDDIFSIYNAKEALMVKDGFTYYKGLKHNEVSVLSFDIESTGLEYTRKDKVLIISNTFRKNGVVTRKLFSYDEFESQGAMIDAWCDWVRLMDPSIIAGHNIFSYDLIYLAHCAADNDTSLFLGRDNSDITFDKYESKFRKDGSQFYHYHKVHCYGRELIDTMFLSIKYDIGRKYESYGLKSIIDAEGLQVKDRVFYDAASIRHNYKIKEEWEKIKQYALHDADDALALFDLMAPSFFYLSQSVPKPFQMIIESASGSQINSMMIRSYLQDAHSLPKADEVVKFEGATSFGNIGIYKNVFKVDVASLYPSVMLHYNIHDSSKDPNANLSKILKIFTEERLKNKKLAKTDKYFSDLEQSQKIIINSMYGFMGAPGLLFNYPLGAAMVTERGREILADSIKWATAKELTIVNGDTDSISFCNNDRSEFTKETQDDLLKDLNSKFPSMIHWEHDGIYKSVIIIATKNYVLWDGVKLKYKGSAIKASTKEPALKEFIKVIIDAMLNDQDNYVEIYHRYVKEILDVKDMKRWASRKTLTEAVFSSPRLNETKIKDAVAGTEYVKGDRVYMYFLPDESLGLLENFDGNYNITTLLHKLYATGEIFSSILDTKTMFPNYKLKRNKEKLKEVS